MLLRVRLSGRFRLDSV